MKTRLSIVLVVVLLLAVTVTALAANYQWKQGYAVGHGRGTGQWWYADLTGVMQTYSSVSRKFGDGLFNSSDSEAEAMACEAYKLTQVGTYRITTSRRLNGRLYADAKPGTAWSNISLVIRAWQGAWPGPAGHKFVKELARVTDTSPLNWKQQTVNGTFSWYVNYPVTNIGQPVKVCWGINSFSYARGYGSTNSDFHPAHRSAEDIGTVSVELVK